MGKDLFNDRISRFSIRKLNVEFCSVLLGTLVMVGTASSVAAEENAENPATVAWAGYRRRGSTCYNNRSCCFYDS